MKFVEGGLLRPGASLNCSYVLLIFLASTFLFSTANSQDRAKGDLSFIKLPEGFKIEVFAQVPDARSLVRSDSGYIFVSTRNAGKVYAIKDTDGDNKADVVKVLAEDLDKPIGIALKDGNVYVAAVSQILRFDDIEKNLDQPKFVVVKDGLPKNATHAPRYISFGPDGKLYIGIGSPCDICDAGDPYASIWRMNPDGTEFENFARGIRNTVGFDWDPKTGGLWFTDNGRDGLGDDEPRDELNHAATSGLHFGYPYCQAGDIKDPDFGGTRECKQFTPPSLKLEPHVAPLGVNFYSGSSFPKRYVGGMFIAQHGSRDRKPKLGYNVKFVKVEGDKVVSEEVFAEGWLQGDTVQGRPVDTEELADGSLLVSDDGQGLVYRISYAETIKNIAEAAKTPDCAPVVYQILRRNN